MKMEQPDPNGFIRPTDPDLLKKITDDVFKESGFLERHGPKPLEGGDKVVYEAGQVTDRVWKLIAEIVRTDHARGGKYNRDAAFATIHKLTRDEFSKGWSKDDLLFLVCQVHSEFLLGKCDDLANQLL